MCVVVKTEKINAYPGSHVVPGGRTGVLLLHSLGGHPGELRFVAQAFAAEGYTVYCPLLPGFGVGTDPSGLSSWKDWYAALEAAHDELKSRCDVILGGGFSAGAILMLRLASERPAGLGGLVLFSPTIWPNGWAIPRSLYLFKLIWYKWFARLFRFQRRAPFGIKNQRIRELVIASFTKEYSARDLYEVSGAVVWEFKSLVSDVRRRLGRIRMPVHIFHPREDDQSDLDNAVTIARRLGGSVELTVLDDSYHLVTLDRQWSLVVKRTVDFARGVTRTIEERVPIVPLAKSGGAAE